MSLPPLLNEVKMIDGLILPLCPDCNDPIKEDEKSEEHGNPHRHLYHSYCWDRSLNEKIACDQIDYGEEKEIEN